MKKALLFIAVILLSACSSKFGYNNADWLIYWYLDDYVELTSDQEDVFDKKMTGWMRWHRNEELAKYKAHLLQVKDDVLNGKMTPERVTYHLDQGTSHWERVRDHLSPQIAELAATLDEKQISYFFAALEKENKEEEEKIREADALDDEERLSRRIEDLQQNVEGFIGKMTEEQKAIVIKYAPNFTSTRKDWLAYRRDIQQAARQLFATRNDNPQFVTDLNALIQNPDAYRGEQYQVERRFNRVEFGRMLSEVSTTLTNKQKDKLIDELDGIIADLNDLMEDNE